MLKQLKVLLEFLSMNVLVFYKVFGCQSEN